MNSKFNFFLGDFQSLPTDLPFRITLESHPRYLSASQLMGLTNQTAIIGSEIDPLNLRFDFGSRSTSLRHSFEGPVVQWIEQWFPVP